MENTKTKKQNEVGATVCSTRGLTITVGGWFARLVDYGRVPGGLAGLSGLTFHSKMPRPGHQSHIDI